MTDPASPAAVTEERELTFLRELIDVWIDTATGENDRAHHFLDTLLDARGLELARRDEEVARLKMAAEDLRAAVRDATNARVAAEARLAQANEALDKIAQCDAPRSRAEIYRTDGKHSKHDKCEHGRAMHEDCDSCIAAFAHDVVFATANPNPTPPAQSAGEALDPAGTGEGASDEAKKAANTLRIVSHMLPTTNGDTVRKIADLITAQASALAEARRSALEEAAKVCDRFNGYMAQLAAKAIRALTEPQHD